MVTMVMFCGGLLGAAGDILNGYFSVNGPMPTVTAATLHSYA